MVQKKLERDRCQWENEIRHTPCQREAIWLISWIEAGVGTHTRRICSQHVATARLHARRVETAGELQRLGPVGH